MGDPADSAIMGDPPIMEDSALCLGPLLPQVDVQSGETRLWGQEGHIPGEPIFVARPGGEREDDGVLLSVVLAGALRWRLAAGSWRLAAGDQVRGVGS